MDNHSKKETSSDVPKNTNPANMALNVNKAGMEGLDTAKINEIIAKASGGSKFYLHKQKCQARLNEKITQMKRNFDILTQDQILKAEEEMTKIAQEFCLSRNLTKTIVHIDMDMFYAAVEMRDNPSLKEKPMAVGGTDMLSTSNYVARKFGVRAAMPGFIALKLCPNLIIVPSNFSKYKQVSKEVKEIFKDYDPNFAMMSLDEGYLDITDFIEQNHEKYLNEETNLSAAEEVVKEIRRKIEEKTSLTASAGIAPNTRLAKVCSDMNKPNGQYFLPPTEDAIMEFINKLPIRKISGIGSVSEQQLKALGIETCSDLYLKRGLLRLLFTETSYLYFLRISLGIGSTEIESSSERDRKSISTETTFKGTSDSKVLFTLCKDLCRELQGDLEAKEMLGKVFTIKFKDVNFKIKTRAQTLVEPTNEAETFIPIAIKLLQHEMDQSPPDKPLALRLLGVRMSNLCHKSEIGPKKQQTIASLLQKFKTSEDSLPHKEKKDDSKPVSNKASMRSMGDFASYKAWKTKANGQPHTCLVCSQRLCFPTLSDFNDHVFRCLKTKCDKSPSEESSNNSKIPSKEEIQKSSMNSLEDLEETQADFIENKVVQNSVEDKQKLTESINVDKIEETAGPSCSKLAAFQGKPELLRKDDQPSKGDDVSSGNSDHGFESDEDCEEISEASLHLQDSDAMGRYEKLLCPVCNIKGFSDNLSLNLHLDICLNGNLVKELVKQSNCEYGAKESANTSTNSSRRQISNKSLKRKIPQNKKGKKQLKSSSKILHKYLGIL